MLSPPSEIRTSSSSAARSRRIIQQTASEIPLNQARSHRPQPPAGIIRDARRLGLKTKTCYRESKFLEYKDMRMLCHSHQPRYDIALSNHGTKEFRLD
ncbi:hypothetical protein GX51_01020 [Blastomyces parvus]|uniref:Uncharacterized protein n=1 Tax=Blastomyces parvus TaxID=2060905 RepID=A0A2B7XJM6_9EURO|nr:hypothetical protein GX51_01020 [Blastomyces parvus]